LCVFDGVNVQDHLPDVITAGNVKKLRKKIQAQKIEYKILALQEQLKQLA